MYRRLSEVLNHIGYDQSVADRFADVVLPFTPMQHQLEGLHLVLYYPRFGLYFEPRTGKTLVMQMAAIFTCAYGDRVMQVMPPGLTYQFRADYAKITGHGLNIQILNQGPATRKKLLAKWELDCPNVVLLSPAMFKAHWRDLAALNFRHVHFDEAHTVLQDETNQTSTALKGWLKLKDAHRLVLSTGTPIPNRVENAYNIVSLTNPTAYRSKKAFELEHVVRKPIMVPGVTDMYGRPRSIMVVDYYTGLTKLSKNLYHRGIHASQRVVLKADAPNIQIIACELTRPHRKLYREVMRTRVLELDDGEIIDARSAQKLRQTALQLISCPEHYGGHPTHNSLYDTLDGLVSTFKEDQKVVVFANFTRTVELIADRFRSWKPVTIYGPNKSERNAEHAEVFKTDRECRMLVANPIAGGVGFTLGEVCTTVVFAEPVESPGVFQQCISRVLLVGQTEPVLCYIIQTVDTIASVAIDHMIGKVKDINEIMRLKKSIFEVLLCENPS